MVSVLIEAIRYQENGYSIHFHLGICHIPFYGKETAVGTVLLIDPGGILLLCGVQSRRKRLLLCCK